MSRSVVGLDFKIIPAGFNARLGFEPFTALSVSKGRNGWDFQRGLLKGHFEIDLLRTE